MRRLLVALIATAGVAWAQTVVPPFGAASTPVATPPQATASAPAPVPPPQPPQPAFVQPPAPPVAARTPAPPAAPTPPVKGLPADAPKLVVNGGTYSERRDMRLAIVNGNVVREGANVDGVVVEQIQPDGLVLAFRGSRYHVTY
jgi:general secretion pathway protein B